MPKNLFGNVGPLLVIALIALVALEVWVVKNSASIILAANAKPTGVTLVTGERVNFTSYNEVVKRIQDAGVFLAEPGNPPNPFTVVAPIPTPTP